MSTRWPVPPPLPPDAVGLSRYGDTLLAALGQRDASAPVAAEAGRPLVDVLAQLARVLQSATPGGVRRQTSWWGRLLGRDVEGELDARDWQPRLGVLLAQAGHALQAVREQQAQRQAAQARAVDAAQVLEQWAEAAHARVLSLPAPLQDVLAQRVDHLRRLAALQQVEAGQWQLLAEQDAALLARSHRITETLLPAWRQTVLARQAGDQQQRNQQAAQLQAQISAELASAQARLH